tara:strand:- start:496 stop:783 length:288 start_codon:yes stop_codon:yes gene_type:complete
MTDEEKKARANPSNQIVQAIERMRIEILEKKDTELKVHNAFRETILESNTRKFRMSIVAVLLTTSILWLDVLKLDESSVIVAGLGDVFNIIRELL